MCKVFRSVLIAVVGVCVCTFVTIPAAQSNAVIPQPFLALTHAQVVNVRTGEIARDVTLVVRDGRIVSIGPGGAPAGAQVIDIAGRFLLPGLMDAHTHLDNLAAARRALLSGATTVRSASVGSFRDVAIRDMAKGGYIAGPDMLAAGVFVTPNLEDTILADPALAGLTTGVRGADRLRLVVQVNLAHGVDVIKTRGTERAGTPDTDPREQVYSEEELRVIVEEAAKKNVPILAHAHGEEGARAAVLAGARSIEHGTYLSDDTLRLMKQTGTFLVPTYSTLIDLVEPGGDYDNPVVHNRGLFMMPRAKKMIQRARALGVRIVAGTDTSYGPESVTRVSHEITNFVDIGLTPLEALQSATIVAAELFRIEKQTGALEPGLEADIIAVDENPLENIRAVQDVLVVISNGRIALNRAVFARK
jgi:imidazolonepropionase-like amidohydrolase